MKNKVLRRLSLKQSSLGERGDTIVEVMIVLAVLGMAIGISYATANRSLLNARQAQENSQAAELVQSQIEQLRTLTKSNCTTSPIDNDHCIYNASSGGPSTPFCLVGGKVKSANTTSGCTNAGENGRYKLTITRNDTTDTFTVTAKWDDVLGEGVDTVTLSYRLPQPPILANDGGSVGGSVGGSPTGLSVVATGSPTTTPGTTWPNSIAYSVPITITGGTPGENIILIAAAPNDTYLSCDNKKSCWNTFTFDANGTASGTMVGLCTTEPGASNHPWDIYITGPSKYLKNGKWVNTGNQVCP